MKKILPLACICLLAGACTSEKKDPNLEASPMLEAARELMSEKNYEAATDTILSMRKKYPTALEVRRQGILVMDSIELLQAQDSLKVLNGILQIEKQKLDSISRLNNRGRNSPYYDQKNKVFYLRQNMDEMDAKVKFFIRKIEEDKKS
ncbi:MAG: hypothetical protein H9789_04445 [Candidatus Paraprevotella stercoravium]|jgi:PDZ domain-containing secreted protein|uniref:Lipoprotein n=2 Tax=Bacteroidales TaxID=171549 RepID=A0ABT7U323_9BACE|nr:hypothetical protein [Candidatus Paraprevotella stercoravium]MDM8144927.1 hypothetical protein [Bacteroides eggerthii]